MRGLVRGVAFAGSARAARARDQDVQVAAGSGPVIRVSGTGPGTTFIPFVPSVETQYQLPLGDVIAQDE